MKLVLVLNAGSSSVKFALIDVDHYGNEQDIARGAVDGIGQTSRWNVHRSDGVMNSETTIKDGIASNHKEALSHIVTWIDKNYGLTSLAGAGHRVVHGGAHFTKPVRLTAENIEALRKLVPLAPLHQPHNLAAIDSLTDLAPTLPQIACFDTAFHSTIPDVGREFALPRSITALGVKRYGFHGLSYSYIAKELANKNPELSKGRVLVAHLGNGASLCAMKEGKSIATTMGFSALDGLMMGTRTGSIDPAVIFYLMRDQGMSADDIETLFYQKSGLLGVSGISNDMRTLREAAHNNRHAREALELFTYRIIRDAGAMIAVLGGIDALVFTAGIGENDTQLRADLIRGLSFMGFALDEAANAGKKRMISGEVGPVALVIPTNEEVMIARETAMLIDCKHK